jgi:myosin heavy subunit
MNHRQNCKGMVKSPDGTFRPCLNTGNFVQNNGFCLSHQNQAASTLIEQVSSLSAELDDLQAIHRGAVDEVAIKNIQRQIAEVTTHLQTVRTVCTANPECVRLMKTLSVSVHQLISPDGEPNTLPTLVTENKRGIFTRRDPLQKIKSLTANIEHLSKGTKGDDAATMDISNRWELSKLQKEANLTKIDRLETELQSRTNRYRHDKNQFQKKMRTLTSDLEKTSQLQVEAEHVTGQLEKRLSDCHSKTLHIGTEYSSILRVEKEKTQRFKRMYDDMVGREVSLNTSLKHLAESEEQLKNDVLDLKESYEEKMRILQNRPDSEVVSQREAHLTQQVEKLSRDLELSMRELKIAVDSGRQAIDHVQTSHLPCSDLARELVTTGRQLQAASGNVMKLQKEIDQNRDTYANTALKYEMSQERRSSGDRKKIQVLESEVVALGDKLQGAKKDVIQLEKVKRDLKLQAQNNIRKLRSDLNQAKQQVTRCKLENAHNTSKASSEKRMLNDARRSKQVTQDFEYQQKKERLRQEFETKQTSLESAHRLKNEALNQTKRELHNVKIAQEALKENLTREENRLKASRDDYETKMIEYAQRNTEINSARLDAQHQSDQVAISRRDHIRQVDTMRQARKVQDRKSRTEIKDLKNKLDSAQRARSGIIANLEACGAAKESIIIKANALSAENDRLKESAAHQKTRYDLLVNSYEKKLLIIQTQSHKIKAGAERCTANMSDLALVHDDIIRKKQSYQIERLESEQKIAKLKLSESALRKLLQNQELNKRTVIKLQASLKACEGGNKVLKNNIKNCSGQLRGLNRLQASVSGELEQTASDYRREILKRDAQMARDANRVKSRENSLKRQMADLKVSRRDLVQQVKQSQRQNRLTEDTLVDTVVNNAQQLQGIIRSDRLHVKDDFPGPVTTGKSNLLQL